MTRPGIIGAAAAVVFIWGASYVALKIALEDLSPGHLALARYLVATIVFLALLAVRRISIPTPRDLFRLALSGAIGIAFYSLILNAGQMTVSAGIASMLVNTVPIWTSLLSVALLGERIGAAGWSGTVLSFTGVALIGFHRSGWSGFEMGTLLIVTAAISQAVYFILAKPLLERHHPIDVTAYGVWFGTLFLLPFGRGLGQALEQASLATLGSVLFLGIGTGALAYIAWFYVLAQLPAGQASNILFLVPVAAIFLGWLILGETLSFIALLGGSLAIAGVLVSKRDQNQQEAPNQERLTNNSPQRPREKP
ncbi:MAG: EamA family transporter [Deltaproteobacteria bacterium]|nr:EamA family transporter [Deltaproteobacteria bacterium]